MAARGDCEVRCKYCGAEFDDTAGGEPMWQCGTYQSHNDKRLMQSLLCQKNELNRYRAMFPVLPWDDSPITPEVCERLGLAHDAEWAARWSLDGTTVSVWCFADGRSQVNDADGEDLATTTAGRLACLIAARKSST